MQDFIHKNYTIIFLAFVLMIIGLSFGLGYQQGKGLTNSGKIVFSCLNTTLEKQKIVSQVLGIQALSINKGIAPQDLASESPKSGAYVGSKNGTKYYTPGCSSSKRIKPSNYIWFQTIEDATLQGYTKGSC